MINKTSQFIFNRKTSVKEQKRKRVVWASQFAANMKIDHLERKLAPDASIVFSKPPTLRNMLVKYKNMTANNTEDKMVTRKCQKCGLCGNFGVLKNMVSEQTTITDKHGNTIALQKNLTCDNHGIYAAQCRICKQLYVGQTINKFSTRWNGHRKKWQNLCTGKEEVKAGNDEAALFKHYNKYHKDIKLLMLPIAEAFEVLFLEAPSFKKLDIRESYWISRLEANINVATTILPKFR